MRMDMNDDQEKAPQSSVGAVELNRQELIRDWELLFWSFLMFGLGRLIWLYVSGAENRAFQLGISCGFLFCGILGFLMRYVLGPGMRGRRAADHE
jgi:hypothetical protein